MKSKEKSWKADERRAIKRFLALLAENFGLSKKQILNTRLRGATLSLEISPVSGKPRLLLYSRTKSGQNVSWLFALHQ